MSNLMTTIYDTIPGYPETAKNLETVKAAPMPVTTGALTPAEQLATDVLTKLADGKPLDLITGAAAAIAEVGAVEVARTALIRVREQLEHRMAELKASNPDLILSGLNSALTDLVDEVRTFRPLSEVTTEAGAITSDRTKEFKHLHALAPRYTSIRVEQLRLMKAETGGDLGTVETLFCRNLPEAFPLWAPWRTHGHLVHDRANRTRDIRPPWPVPSDEGLDRDQGSLSRFKFEQDASRPGFMFWAIEAGVELWVPTLEEYATSGEHYYDALARENRTEPIDEHWLDPGGLDLGAPARGLGNMRDARRVDHAIRMAER